jgi:hypothetical protein
MPTNRSGRGGPTSAAVGSCRPKASVAGHGVPGLFASKPVCAVSPTWSAEKMRPALSSSHGGAELSWSVSQSRSWAVHARIGEWIERLTQQHVPLGQARKFISSPVAGPVVDQLPRRDQGRDGVDIEMLKQAETE